MAPVSAEPPSSARTTDVDVAPSARRMPISFVRRLVTYETTPAMPMHATPSASRAVIAAMEPATRGPSSLSAKSVRMRRVAGEICGATAREACRISAGNRAASVRARARSTASAEWDRVRCQELAKRVVGTTGATGTTGSRNLLTFVILFRFESLRRMTTARWFPGPVVPVAPVELISVSRAAPRSRPG